MNCSFVSKLFDSLFTSPFLYSVFGSAKFIYFSCPCFRGLSLNSRGQIVYLIIFLMNMSRLHVYNA